MRQDGLVSSDPMPTALAGPPEAGAPNTAADVHVTAAPQLTAGPTDLLGDNSGPTVVLLDPLARQTAKDAAVAEAGRADSVGDLLVAVAEDDIAVTVHFAATQPGYLGWQWSVTLAILVEGHPTVSEVVLLPGDGALLAPDWIPWEQRIRPGDVGFGDLLPLTVDDPRVVPAYLQSDDPAVEAVAHELGIGRKLVLSREGRVDFAERLHDGSFGPTGDVALAAPAHCFTCAFYLPLAGSLGQLVGACGNEYSPADGRGVDAGYGCGAHSETARDRPARSAATEIFMCNLSPDVRQRHPHAPESSAEPEEDAVPDAALLES